MQIGQKIWAIPEGHIPSASTGPAPAMESHDTACILNASDEEAHIAIMVYFADQEPVGPYEATISPRRTQHIRFNNLTSPASIPRDTDYASIIASDIPIVVQYTRLDSRQAENALLSTIAYPIE